MLGPEETDRLAAELARRLNQDPWWKHRKVLVRKDAERYLGEVYCIPQERFQEARRRRRVSALEWAYRDGQPVFSVAELDRWAESELEAAAKATAAREG